MTDAAPRVLCIAGSPRRHGNSEQLLDALAKSVEAAGGEAVRLVAAQAGINPCRGCNACSADGHCIQRDGMDAVYGLLDSAEAIVVSTPVFFASVPASLKSLIDRCQPYWARRYVLGEPRPAVKRPGAILVVGGGGDPFGTSCAIAPVQSMFAVLSVAAEDASILTVVGPDRAGDIVCAQAALDRAAELGSRVVQAVLLGRHGG